LKKAFLVLLMVLVSCVITNAATTKKLILAANKKSSYVIAVSNVQIPSEVTASKELQTYIFRSTGVKLPIVKESKLKRGAGAIMLGSTVFAGKVGISPKGSEQWVIRTVGNRLVLAGGRPRGTLYAVYHFLEDIMGIHWWTIWDETVPNHKILSIGSLNLSGTPGFAYREIYDGELAWPKEFYARNRVNGHYSMVPWSFGGTLQYGLPYHVHTFSRYFPPEQYFATHPEWYALTKGKRNPQGQLCLTNKDLFNAWVAKMKDFIKTSYADADKQGIPRPVYFSISQNDWEGSCECDNCKAIYEKEGHSGLSLMFVNAVAAEIEKEYPEILVDTLAYWFYEEAPKTIKPRDNVRIRLCDVGEDVMHPMIHSNNKNGLRRLQDWSKITKHLNIWKYGVVYTPNLPTPSQLDYSDDVKTYKKYGVEGVFIELENIMTTDMWEMKTWMQDKLYEDPNADSDRLVKEFTDGYYGAAGQYIRDYLNVVHKALQDKPSYINFGGSPSGYTFMTLDVTRKCNELFDKAEAAVATDQMILDRVRMARTSLDRTICYRASELNKEYVKNGKQGEFGLSVETSSKRAAAILRKTADLRFAKRTQKPTYAYDQANALEMFTVFSKPAALPAQFANLPADTVFDCSPKYFRLSGVSLVKDPEAAYGSAAKLDVAANGADAAKYLVTPTQGMPMGHYNVVNKTQGMTTTVTYDQIKPGYNYYKLGPTKFNPSEYFYLFWSWVIQADLDSAMNDNPDQEYKVYASVKFEGPSFPHGDPTKTDAILVDRILVVQVKGK